MSAIRPYVRRCVVAWLVLFVVLYTYWSLAEAFDPGQQYADPLLPCAALAMWGMPFAMIWPVRAKEAAADDR